MNVITNLEDIKYFALNLCDLTKLNPVELLLVQDKISSRELIHLNDNIEGTAVLLRSTIIETDYKNSRKLIWKFSRVRSYYSKTGKFF